MERKISIAAFVLTFSFSFLWSFTQPLYGSPDETAHVVKAVATATGQLKGQEATGDFGFAGEIYKVPVAYSQGIEYLGCILGPSHADASCVGRFATGREETKVVSTAAHYPPTYYLLVGPIGLTFPGPIGMYLMRTVSSFLTALVLTAALRTAFRFGGPLRAVGVIVGCTPMVFSLSGAVNPHGLEVSSSILYWVTLLTCLEWNQIGKEKRVNRSLFIQLLLASSLFAFLRPAAFVWMALSTTLIVGYVGVRKTVSSIADSFSARKMLWPVPMALMVSVFFYFWSDVGSSLGGGGEKGSEKVLENLRIAFDRGDDYFRYMFGWFGWVEFSAPPAAFLICVGCLGLALMYGLLNGSVREFGFIVATLVCTVAMPIVLEGLKAASSGFGYQGRYTLALAVGVPILAFWRQGFNLPVVERRMVTVVLVAALLPSFICIDFALKRYSVGETGPKLWFLQAKWLPPGGLFLILATLVVILASLFALNTALRRALSSTEPEVR